MRAGAAVWPCLGVVACGPPGDAPDDRATVSEPSQGATRGGASACGMSVPCGAGAHPDDAGASPAGDADVGDADVGDAASACRPVNAPPIALPTTDSRCYGGASVRELFSLLNSTYGSTFVPQGPPPGTTWIGSMAPSGLTMTFGRVPTSMQCLPAVPSNCDGGDCGPCAIGPVELTVVLPLRFFTADGAFDESLTATVTYVPYPGYPSIQWSANEPAQALQGTYPPMFGRDEMLSFQGKLEPLDQGFVSEAPGPTWVGGGEWGD